MSVIADFDGTLEARLRERLDDDYCGGRRIRSVLTDTVPTRFPGRFVVWVAERGPRSVDSSALLNAAVAVEYADLHRYLHAIPGADGPLISPADTSPYAAESRTAILDGDYIQSRAFSGISGLAVDARTRLECYSLLARASIDRYRDAHAERSTQGFAGFLGHVGRIGAVLGGSDRTTGDRVHRVAAEIGTSVPITTPTDRGQWSDEITTDVQAGLRRLERLLPGDPADPHIETPVEES